MKKVAQNLLKRRRKSVVTKSKSKRTSVQEKNVLVENARKLLSGDINFFNKLKQRNLRRRLSSSPI